MKHFLICAGAAAALVISSASWAQTTPAPAPSGAAAPAAPATPPEHAGSMNRMPAGGKATSERGSGVRTHHRAHATHSTHRKTTSSGSGSAAQLNRQELSGNQAGSPSQMNRMPAGGAPTSGNTHQ